MEKFQTNSDINPIPTHQILTSLLAKKQCTMQEPSYSTLVYLILKFVSYKVYLLLTPTLPKN